MLNAPLTQQVSTLLAASGGEDLSTCGPRDRDRSLPHATSRRVDQDLVPRRVRARLCRPSQAVARAVVTAPPPGRRHPVGQLDGEVASQWTNVPQQPAPDTPPTWSPTCNPSHRGRPPSPRPRNPCRVAAPFPQRPELAERVKNVGEVDAGRGDLHLDLIRPGGTRSNATNSSDSRSPGRRTCSRIPSCSWSTKVVSTLVGTQRSRTQACRVPLAVPPGGFVLLRSPEQLARQLLDAGLLVHVDLRGDADADARC